jgi:hypothetical protein
MRTTVSLALLVVLVAAESVAAQSTVRWPDAIDLLAQQRSQAETCAELLKSNGDKAAVTVGRITYNKRGEGEI